MGLGGRQRPSRKDAHKQHVREALKNLLRDPTFVDYFNIFLSLPVFGQRALFKLHSKTFTFSPPVGANLHNHRVLDWIHEERYKLFTQTRLSHEYLLCQKLLKVALSFRLDGKNVKDIGNPSRLQTLVTNLVGNAAGMYLFRRYLHGTSGARLIACWMHVQAFRKARDPERRAELFRGIRRYYLHPVAVVNKGGNCCWTDKVASDLLNFPVVPIQDRALKARINRGCVLSSQELEPRSRDALRAVQRVLLAALQSYWLPCYVTHVLATQKLGTLKQLFQTSPSDAVTLSYVQALVHRATLLSTTTPPTGEESEGQLPSSSFTVPSLSSFTVPSLSSFTVPSISSLPSVLSSDGGVEGYPVCDQQSHSSAADNAPPTTMAQAQSTTQGSNVETYQTTPGSNTAEQLTTHVTVDLTHDSNATTQTTAAAGVQPSESSASPQTRSSRSSVPGDQNANRAPSTGSSQDDSDDASDASLDLCAHVLAGVEGSLHNELCSGEGSLDAACSSMTYSVDASSLRQNESVGVDVTLTASFHNSECFENESHAASLHDTCLTETGSLSTSSQPTQSSSGSVRSYSRPSGCLSNVHKARGSHTTTEVPSPSTLKESVKDSNKNAGKSVPNDPPSKSLREKERMSSYVKENDRDRAETKQNDATSFRENSVNKHPSHCSSSTFSSTSGSAEVNKNDNSRKSPNNKANHQGQGQDKTNMQHLGGDLRSLFTQSSSSSSDDDDDDNNELDEDLHADKKGDLFVDGEVGLVSRVSAHIEDDVLAETIFGAEFQRERRMRKERRRQRRLRRLQEKRKEDQDSAMKLQYEQWKILDTGELNSVNIANLTKVALLDMVLKHEEVTVLGSLLLHYIFGSRDLRLEDSKTDRRTLCLLACDGSAGFPLRNYLVSRDQELHSNYLDFWTNMRRYVQLRALCCTDDASTRENRTQISRLLERQVRHLARVFLDPLGCPGETPGPVPGPGGGWLFNASVRGRLLKDVVNRRQSTLMNAVMDVVANVISIAVTQYILHDLHVFHEVVLRLASPEPEPEVSTEMNQTECGLPVKRIPSAVFKLGYRRHKGLERKSFQEDRVLSDPWKDEPETETQRRPWGGDMDGVTVCSLMEQHRILAFQYLVNIGEDINTSELCDMTDLTEMIWSDFGSLYIRETPRVRNRFLRTLLPFQRLTRHQMETLTRMTKTLLSVQMGAEELDEPQQPQDSLGGDHLVSCGLTWDMLMQLRKRRNALESNRPPRPKKFSELLEDDFQYTFFRLHLICQGSGCVDALSFWKAVEVAKSCHNEEEKSKLYDLIAFKYLLSSRRENLLVDSKYALAVGTNCRLAPAQMLQLQSDVKIRMEKKWWVDYVMQWPKMEEVLASRVGYDMQWDKDLIAGDVGHDHILADHDHEQIRLLDFNEKSSGSKGEEEKPNHLLDLQEDMDPRGRKRRSTVVSLSRSFSAPDIRLQNLLKFQAFNTLVPAPPEESERSESLPPATDKTKLKPTPIPKKLPTSAPKKSSASTHKTLSTAEAEQGKSSQPKSRTGSELSGKLKQKKVSKLVRKTASVRKESEEAESSADESDSGAESVLAKLGIPVMGTPVSPVPIPEGSMGKSGERSGDISPAASTAGEPSPPGTPGASAGKEGRRRAGKKPKKPKSTRSKFIALSDSADETRKKNRRRMMYKWTRVAKVINAFTSTVRDPIEMRLLETFLRGELERAQSRNQCGPFNPDKPTYFRMASMVVALNKLPYDLRFWVEVDRYRRQVKEVEEALEEMPEEEDTLVEFITMRANAIINCFLNSVTAPMVQINISDQDAYRITSIFSKHGAVYGLFHPAIVRLTPLLLQFWKQYQFESRECGTWNKGKAQLKESYVGSNPHPEEAVPDFSKCSVKDYHVVHVDFNDPHLNLSAKQLAAPVSAGKLSGQPPPTPEFKTPTLAPFGLQSVEGLTVPTASKPRVSVGSKQAKDGVRGPLRKEAIMSATPDADLASRVVLSDPGIQKLRQQQQATPEGRIKFSMVSGIQVIVSLTDALYKGKAKADEAKEDKLPPIVSSPEAEKREVVAGVGETRGGNKKEEERRGKEEKGSIGGERKKEKSPSGAEKKGERRKLEPQTAKKEVLLKEPQPPTRTKAGLTPSPMSKSPSTADKADTRRSSLSSLREGVTPSPTPAEKPCLLLPKLVPDAVSKRKKTKHPLPFMPDKDQVLEPSPHPGPFSRFVDPRSPTVLELERAFRGPGALEPAWRRTRVSGKFAPVFSDSLQMLKRKRPARTPRKSPRTPTPKKSPRTPTPKLPPIRLNEPKDKTKEKEQKKIKAAQDKCAQMLKKKAEEKRKKRKKDEEKKKREEERKLRAKDKGKQSWVFKESLFSKQKILSKKHDLPGGRPSLIRLKVAKVKEAIRSTEPSVVEGEGSLGEPFVDVDVVETTQIPGMEEADKAHPARDLKDLAERLGHHQIKLGQMLGMDALRMMLGPLGAGRPLEPLLPGPEGVTDYISVMVQQLMAQRQRSARSLEDEEERSKVVGRLAEELREGSGVGGHPTSSTSLVAQSALSLLEGRGEPAARVTTPDMSETQRPGKPKRKTPLKRALHATH